MHRFKWSDQALIHTNQESMATSHISVQDPDDRTLTVYFDYSDATAYREVSIYCPIWIINKTGEKITVADVNGVEAAGQYDMEVCIHVYYI
jgi:hypothetical protein